jgi:hypothetical protein
MALTLKPPCDGGFSFFTVLLRVVYCAVGAFLGKKGHQTEGKGRGGKEGGRY